MKILVTGAGGFIGKNLLSALREAGYSDIAGIDLNAAPGELENACSSCDFVFHLAGVNRPPREEDFRSGNTDFTAHLLSLLKAAGNRAPVLATSSTQAGLNNPYGLSKREAERLLFAYHAETGADVLVYRLPGVFGKWCAPNYNSVVATFCHNITRGLPVTVNDPAAPLVLVYIDDVTAEFLRVLEGKPLREAQYCRVLPEHFLTVGGLAEKLSLFQKSRETLFMPPLNSPTDRALYATWLSYLPRDGFSYELDLKADDRGCLAEFIKSASFGQIFISRTKPGVTRGNHWHHTKCEKFLVLEGEAVIRFRPVAGDSEILQYPVSGARPRVVDIPPGYTHSLQNTGGGDLVTLFWSSELFNPDHPDTYYAEVQP